MSDEKPNRRRKILVTSALPYVNNVPHLGNMVCVISADVYTRYLRCKGEEVISVLGTDEHGTTTETIAMEMGLTPKEAVDHFYKIHKEVYEWFECSFDCFGRTSNPENSELTQEIFLKLHDNGYIVEREQEQMYDEKAKKFLSDRFIEGQCPHCKYEEARGDQCEKCGKLLNPTELINPKSKLTGTVPVVRKTKHLFIRLDALQPKLESFVKERESKWSDNARTQTHAWLKEGLQERPITRDLEWGIKVPLKGYEHKVFYVWFDAPIGYISITKGKRDDWKKWWLNPENVKLVQFMGKDNIPFHTILFPASLLGTADNYTMLDSISVNEYLNYEDSKFSKSRGVGVFGDDAKNTGIPADVWRYYLIINRPETADTKFTWSDFQEKINSDLVGNIGNLVNRTLTFIAKYCDGEVKEAKKGLIFEETYALDINAIIADYERAELKKALKGVLALARKGNQYFQEQEPWKQIKENKDEAENTLAVLVNLIKDISILLEPVMPRTALNIQTQLGITIGFKHERLQEKIKNHKIGEPKPIFSKLEDSDAAILKEKFAGKQGGSAISKLDLRIARIESVRKHPEAEKLYIEEISLGEEKRTIVSGLVPYYSPEELEGKNVIIVYNLKPAKLRGVLSQGMLLAASDSKSVGVLNCPEGKPGDKILLKGVKHEPGKEISIEEFAQISIEAASGKVTADGHELKGEKDIIVDREIQGKVK